LEQPKTKRGGRQGNNIKRGRKRKLKLKTQGKGQAKGTDEELVGRYGIKISFLGGK